MNGSKSFYQSNKGGLVSDHCLKFLKPYMLNCGGNLGHKIICGPTCFGINIQEANSFYCAMERDLSNMETYAWKKRYYWTTFMMGT